jgi:hypothetical protein
MTNNADTPFIDPSPPWPPNQLEMGTFAAKKRDVHMAPLRSEILLNIDARCLPPASPTTTRTTALT